jgi:hypothetical protein
VAVSRISYGRHKDGRRGGGTLTAIELGCILLSPYSPITPVRPLVTVVNRVDKLQRLTRGARVSRSTCPVTEMEPVVDESVIPEVLR